jgi:hypothetical protein
MDPIIVGSEFLMLIIKMWMTYQKSQGLTDEQINESFARTFGKFMVESAVPVEPVKE